MCLKQASEKKKIHQKKYFNVVMNFIFARSACAQYVFSSPIEPHTGIPVESKSDHLPHCVSDSGVSAGSCWEALEEGDCVSLMPVLWSDTDWRFGEALRSDLWSVFMNALRRNGDNVSMFFLVSHTLCVCVATY